MAAKLLQAWDLGGSWRFDYHLDTDRVVPDQRQVVELTGAPAAVSAAAANLVAAGGRRLDEQHVLLDRAAVLPDPNTLKSLTYGKTDAEDKPLSLAAARDLAEHEVAALVAAAHPVPVEV